MSELDRLTAAEREWLISDESLWRKAYAAAAANPALEEARAAHESRNRE